MKYPGPRAGIFAVAAGMAGLGAWAGTTQPLPTPFPESRYERMSTKSPFAMASATGAATAAPTPGFAAQLYVDGVAHVGQTDFVAIKSREPDKPTVFLEVGQSSNDGMKVESVKWSDQMGRSTVQVSKGGEKAVLAFDEATLRAVTGANGIENAQTAPMPFRVSKGYRPIPGRPIPEIYRDTN